MPANCESPAEPSAPTVRVFCSRDQAGQTPRAELQSACIARCCETCCFLRQSWLDHISGQRDATGCSALLCSVLMSSGQALRPLLQPDLAVVACSRLQNPRPCDEAATCLHCARVTHRCYERALERSNSRWRMTVQQPLTGKSGLAAAWPTRASLRS